MPNQNFSLLVCPDCEEKLEKIKSRKLLVFIVSTVN